MNQSYAIRPINNLRSVLSKFSYVAKKINDGDYGFNNPVEDEKIENIEFIHCKQKTVEEAVIEINSLGYRIAPAPYLLGLMVEHPELVKIGNTIVSLDQKNSLVEDGKLRYLDFYNTSGEVCMGLTTAGMQIQRNWKIAVIRNDAKINYKSKSLGKKSWLVQILINFARKIDSDLAKY